MDIKKLFKFNKFYQFKKELEYFERDCTLDNILKPSINEINKNLKNYNELIEYSVKNSFYLNSGFNKLSDIVEYPNILNNYKLEIEKMKIISLYIKIEYILNKLLEVYKEQEVNLHQMQKIKEEYQKIDIILDTIEGFKNIILTINQVSNNFKHNPDILEIKTKKIEEFNDSQSFNLENINKFYQNKKDKVKPFFDILIQKMFQKYHEKNTTF